MKKLMTLCLAVLALALGSTNVLAASAEATATAKKPAVATKKKPVVVKKKSAAAVAPPVSTSSMVILEPMWTAGGQEYKDAVSKASYQYAAVMDEECRTKEPFDVSAVAKVYRVFTPAGLESVRDSWIRKQVGTLACITMHRDDGEERAEKNLKM